MIISAFGRLEAVAPLFLRMGERQRQRVGGVGRGRFGQVQHALHHLGDGQFLRRAVADDGLLHLARGDFVNLQAGLGDGRQRRAARLAHDQRGLQVLRVKQALDHAHRGLVLLEDLAQASARSSPGNASVPSRPGRKSCRARAFADRVWPAR